MSLCGKSTATGAEARKDALEWARWESERDDFISFMESQPRTEVQIGPLTESLASKAKEMEALQKGLQSSQVAIGGRATLTAEGSVILAPGGLRSSFLTHGEIYHPSPPKKIANLPTTASRIQHLFNHFEAVLDILLREVEYPWFVIASSRELAQILHFLR